MTLPPRIYLVHRSAKTYLKRPVYYVPF